MKTILYTGHDLKYMRLADITVPRMMEYAKRHGMDFMSYNGSRPKTKSPDDGIYWLKYDAALELFGKGYKRLIWLDADQLITNLDHEIQKMGYGFHASKDWGNDAVEDHQFSVCGFLLTDDLRPEIISLSDSAAKFNGQPFPEQAPTQELYKRIPHWFTIHPRKVFNSVPEAVCPGQVPEPWAPGDFAAHITMVDLPRRVEIAHQILSTL